MSVLNRLKNLSNSLNTISAARNELIPYLDELNRLEKECHQLFETINRWRWMNYIQKGVSKNRFEKDLREYKKNILHYKDICDKLDELRNTLNTMDPSGNKRIKYSKSYRKY